MSVKKYEKPQISRQQLEELLLQANDQLTIANQKLRQEEVARMELLTNLSHDLRSPLAALLSSVELLKSDPDGDPQERYAVLELMERRLGTLQNLLNDLFLLTKLDSSSLELKKEKVEIGYFLEEFFYNQLADTRYDNRRLDMDIPENLHLVAEIDPQQMSRVLDNLFTNALKYSETDARIKLSLKQVDGRIAIQVEDTGFGIGKENLERIFERSFRVSKSRTPGDNSSGLGLAIAKGIVEKHGGSIRCDSVWGEGSVFTVYLPQATEI